ncbi:hypothetical protein OG625_20470 [Streptomyces sp. NBC_01351]|uniref:terpene synthase family protein n=1 Tax=Streptomyces sp. NBC_01351 TaxID=2903833 RepID=UPI002E30A7D0|nr:hypothetical protein [Streptomyces sp. NBC_01351]
MTATPPDGAVPVRIEVPAVYCPVPYAIHPEAIRLESRSVAWLDRFGLGRDQQWVAAINCGEAAALTLPAVPVDIAQIYSDLCYLALAIDDAPVGSGPQALEGVLAYMAGYVPRVVYTLKVPDAGVLEEAHPFEAPWIDLAHRIHARTTPGQTAHFAEAVRDWLGGMLWEETNPAGQVPSINTYVARRISSMGAFTAAALVAAATAVTVDERDMPPVQALRGAATLLIIMDNDVFSFGRESGEANPASRNLVHLLAHQGLATDQAVAEVLVLRDQVMRLFVDLSDQVKTSGSPQLRDYLTGLSHLVRGALDWHLRERTHRYAVADGPLVSHAGITDQPPGQVGQPPALPAIRWWWDHLDAPRSSLLR